MNTHRSEIAERADLRRLKHLASAALAALIALGVVGCTSPDRNETPERANIVFVLVDTLRADHLGVYGYERDTSPAIDSLAAKSLVFDAAFSVAPWTNPSIATLFTGRYPHAVLPEAKHSVAIEQTLPAEVPTLAELLRDAGYRTAGLVDHPGINRKRGYARGFDAYTMLYEKGARGGKWWSITDSGYVLGEVNAAFDAFGDEPFFLYLHLVYPHTPYRAPPPFGTMYGPPPTKRTKEQRDAVINAYDAEIRYADDLIGKVMSALEARDLLGTTAVVLTSDHGEQFWDHGGAGHGDGFYDEVVRVPLILKLPENRSDEAARVESIVSLVDVFPSVLELAGMKRTGGADGRSLLSFRDREDRERRSVFVSHPHSRDVSAVCLIDDRYKYVATSDPRRAQLFDRVEDPGERENLAKVRAEASKARQAQVDAHTTAQRARLEALERKVVPADPDTVDRLRALGYVDD